MDSTTLHADVVIAGGGMAGVCAAIAAARSGAKTILVQDRSVLGGNASSEIRMHIVGADIHGQRKGWRESGLIEELRLEDSVRNPERCYPFWDVILYEKVVAEPNLTLLLETDVVGVEMAFGGLDPKTLPARTTRMYVRNGPPGRIAAVRAVRQITEDEFIIHAKMFADCTGDGRLGFEAGADFRIGRESVAMHGESLAQPVDDLYTLGSSMLLTSRKLDRPAPFVAPPWARRFDPEQLKVGRGIHSWEYGFWWIEWGGVLDTLKDNCTTIRHELYRIALGLWDYVKNSGLYPESANWTLDWVGAVPGKRESRRFVGPHMLTQQDVTEAIHHKDEVAYGGWSIDLHPPRGMDAIDEYPCTQTEVRDVYGIPLRSLFSRNVENLFFAGRNMSATHVAFASTRVMATCSVCGEAVGYAAAACAAANQTPAELIADEIAMRKLQQSMLKGDSTLPYVPTDVSTNLATLGKIRASSVADGCSIDLIVNGATRDVLDSKNGALIECRGWRSKPIVAGSPQWIEVSWDKPVRIGELHLWFDTGFQRELALSASDWCNSHVHRGPQPETVRDYRVIINGNVALDIKSNYSRKRVHTFSDALNVRTLRVEIIVTHGVPEARVFELRVF